MEQLNNNTQTTEPVPDDIMTRQEVADYLKVSLPTADKFIHQKDFEGLLYIGRSVRVSRLYLKQYVQDHLQYKI